MEKLKLVVPVQVDKGATDFSISLVIMDWKGEGGVRVDFSEIDKDDVFVSGGKRIEKNLRGDEAAKFLYWLSTANFTEVSMKEAIANYFLSKKDIPAATMTGKPVDPMIAIQAKIDAAKVVPPVVPVVPVEPEKPVKPVK